MAFVKPSFGPPTMKVRVPSCAPPIPPETGASTGIILWFLEISATLLADATSTVEQSRKTEPCFMYFIVSFATDLSISPFGNIVITTSAVSTQSLAVGTISTISTFNTCVSKPNTVCPAFAKLWAI